MSHTAEPLLQLAQPLMEEIFGLETLAGASFTTMAYSRKIKKERKSFSGLVHSNEPAMKNINQSTIVL